MSSVAQIEANRGNAQLSTGPATIEGLARSSRNARTHGITMNIANLQGDELASFDQLLAALVVEFKPSGPLEHRCVREMAAAEWRMESIATRQESLFQGDIDQNARALSLLLRYESAARRSFERALAMLRQNRLKPLHAPDQNQEEPQTSRRRMSYEEREARLERLFGKSKLALMRGESDPQDRMQNEPDSAPSRR